MCLRCTHLSASFTLQLRPVPSLLPFLAVFAKYRARPALSWIRSHTSSELRRTIQAETITSLPLQQCTKNSPAMKKASGWDKSHKSQEFLKLVSAATSHPKPHWTSLQQHLFVLVLAQLCMLPQHAFADTIPCQTRIQHAEAILIRFKSSNNIQILASFPNQFQKSEGGSLIELTSAPCQGIAQHYLQIHQLHNRHFSRLLAFTRNGPPWLMPLAWSTK